MTPKRELKLITNKLKAARKGIILFHDPNGGHAAGLLALSQGQRLSRRPRATGRTRCRQTALTPNSLVKGLQLRLHSRRSM